MGYYAAGGYYRAGGYYQAGGFFKKLGKALGKAASFVAKSPVVSAVASVVPGAGIIQQAATLASTLRAGSATLATVSPLSLPGAQAAVAASQSGPPGNWVLSPTRQRRRMRRRRRRW